MKTYIYLIWTILYLAVVWYIDIVILKHGGLSDIWYFIPAFVVPVAYLYFYMHNKKQCRQHPAMEIVEYMQKRKMLIDLIEYNAEHIIKTEGKDKHEATYLSICTALADLSTRPRGSGGFQLITQDLLLNEYKEHHTDVMMYLTWMSGKVIFKPEFEEKMQKRHNVN